MTALACSVLSLALSAAPTALSVDTQQTTLTLHVGKTGAASFAGHEHAILAHPHDGLVNLDRDDPTRSSVALTFDAKSLQVSAEGEPAGDAPKVQAAMLGPDVLDAAKYPAISFHSIGIRGAPARDGAFRATLDGELTLHGKTQRISLPADVTIGADALTASGHFVLKQTDFGITPTSAAGGLVKVKDAVDVDFKLVARADAQK